MRPIRSGVRYSITSVTMLVAMSFLSICYSQAGLSPQVNGFRLR